MCPLLLVLIVGLPSDQRPVLLVFNSRSKNRDEQAETTTAVSTEQASPSDGKGRPSINPASQFTNYIGTILTATLSNDEAISKIQGLTEGKKYHLLANHFKPPQEYDFTSKYLHKWSRQKTERALVFL